MGEPCQNAKKKIHSAGPPKKKQPTGMRKNTGQETMPSLTPLHETYCKWDRTPPSQADVLEGLAQLVTMRFSDVVHDLIQNIQRELLISVFGMSEQGSKQFHDIPSIARLYQLAYETFLNYGTYLLAPGLRSIIEKFPKLHEKQLTPSLHFLVGALNGVLGDYLLQQHNPMALPMVVYDHYGAVQQGELTGRITLLVHGLCMNHLTWSTRKYGGIGEKLLAQRDHNTMLYLNYNTGRRISANGRSLSAGAHGLCPAEASGAHSSGQNCRAYRQYPQQRHSGFALRQRAR